MIPKADDRIIGEPRRSVWFGRVGGKVDLYWATIGADDKAAKPQRLTDNRQTDSHARIASGAGGKMTLVYQSFRDGLRPRLPARPGSPRRRPGDRLVLPDVRDVQATAPSQSFFPAWSLRAASGSPMWRVS